MGRGGGRGSSSFSSSASSSGDSGFFGSRFNMPAQSASYSGSSSWSSSYGGQSGYQQQPDLAQFNQYAGYQSPSIPLAPAEAVCTQKPKAIPNAKTQCSLTTKTCTVQCFSDYQLPNGETKAKMYCNNGDWALENLEWSDKLACERK